MNPTDLETRLVTAYRNEAACYSEALQAARDLDAALRQGQNQNVPLERMLALFDRIAVIEADMSECKRLWQQSSRRPGPELQAVLFQVEDLIQAMRGCVVAAEQQARAVSDRLAPQLDQLVRGRQMQRAYGGAMARGETPSVVRGQ